MDRHYDVTYANDTCFARKSRLLRFRGHKNGANRLGFIPDLPLQTFVLAIL